MVKQHSFVRFFASLAASGHGNLCDPLLAAIRLELSVKDRKLNETLNWIYKNQDLWPEKAEKIKKGMNNVIRPFVKVLDSEFKTLTLESINYVDSREFRNILEKAMLTGRWSGKIGNA